MQLKTDLISSAKLTNQYTITITMPRRQAIIKPANVIWEFDVVSL